MRRSGTGLRRTGEPTPPLRVLEVSSARKWCHTETHPIPAARHGVGLSVGGYVGLGPLRTR